MSRKRLTAAARLSQYANFTGDLPTDDVTLLLLFYVQSRHEALTKMLG